MYYGPFDFLTYKIVHQLQLVDKINRLFIICILEVERSEVEKTLCFFKLLVFHKLQLA